MHNVTETNKIYGKNIHKYVFIIQYQVPMNF